MDRECSADGCCNLIAHDKLMCYRHWHRLNARTKAWVLKEYKEGIPYSQRKSVSAAIEEIRKTEGGGE